MKSNLYSLFYMKYFHLVPNIVALSKFCKRRSFPSVKVMFVTSQLRSISFDLLILCNNDFTKTCCSKRSNHSQRLTDRNITHYLNCHIIISVGFYNTIRLLYFILHFICKASFSLSLLTLVKEKFY